MKLFIVLADLYYGLLSVFAVLSTRNVPVHYIGGDKVKNPVILIPGVGNPWLVLKKLADYLSYKGYPIYVVPALGRNLFDIPKSSKIVRELIDINDLKNVVLVGYSKGGIVGKYFLIHDNADNRVLGLVAIASPFSGSHLVKFLILKVWTQFSPYNQLMLDLAKNEQVNKKIISIYSSFDTLVWHRNKSYLKNSLENINVGPKGHIRIVADRKVHEQIEKSIEKLIASR